MLKLRPGVNSELTPSQLEAGYAVSNLIRFRDGLAEKLGGWRKFYQFAVGGVPKALHAWQDLNDVRYLGVGTTTKVSSVSLTASSRSPVAESVPRLNPSVMASRSPVSRTGG